MIFLRHPRPDVASGICYGRLDLPVSPEGEATMESAVAALSGPAAILTSPAMRCRLLADRIAARFGVAPMVDERLAELDFGAWEGLAWDRIDRAESDPWAADPWRIAPPGGETFAALHARVGAVLAEVAAGAVLVTHAGPIRAARMILTGAAFETVFAEPVPYAEPILFAYQENFQDG